LINLISNEWLKLVRKKRLYVVTFIIALLISMFTYAQMKEAEQLRERLGTSDWRTTLQQQIIDIQNRLSGSRISDEWKKELQIRVQQYQYYLDHNINPTEPGAPTFVREFINHSIQLFLPLMVIIVASDLVSSEYTIGTVKLLLTRPVKRWKILLSKYITLLLSISWIISVFLILTYLISGIVFGFSGWNAPVLTGFGVDGNELDTSNVHLVPQWKYIFMQLGLAWFVAIIIGTISFTISVLIKSTAAGMGIMIALLISGTILSNMVSSWESAKYLFMVNLELTDYLKGDSPPVEGMSLSFSMTVLFIWGFLSLIIAFTYFTRKDVY
jgi:ABC-2 type transport system permease protein